MIVSLLLARVGITAWAQALRRPPDPAHVAGLRWATSATQLKIGVVPPRPRPGRVGLISVWDGDPALDAFLAQHPWGDAQDRYEIRLDPLQAVGNWPGLADLATHSEPGVADRPVGVLTLGRLKLSQTARFFRATARAEESLLAQPALLASTGLARPPFLATFSLWRSLEGMKEYAYRTPGGHRDASAAHRARPFHSESIFIRLRPYRAVGTWDGVDPLAGLSSQ